MDSQYALDSLRPGLKSAFGGEADMDRQAKVAGEPLPRVTVGLAPRSRLQAKLKVYAAARQAI